MDDVTTNGLRWRQMQRCANLIMIIRLVWCLWKCRLWGVMSISQKILNSRVHGKTSSEIAFQAGKFDVSFSGLSTYPLLMKMAWPMPSSKSGLVMRSPSVPVSSKTRTILFSDSAWKFTQTLWTFLMRRQLWWMFLTEIKMDFQPQNKRLTLWVEKCSTTKGW